MTSILKSLSIEPSGYLQWDEFDTTTFAAHTPASNVTKEAADELIQVWHKFAAKLDIQLGYFLIYSYDFDRQLNPSLQLDAQTR